MRVEDLLADLFDKYNFKGKGPLSVGLVVTRHAKKMGLPINPEDLIAESGGQVVGLGSSPVQSILKEHGIDRVLAKEGGRTSRGSIAKMKAYVSLLNELNAQMEINLDEIEKWWIKQVIEFFEAQPFILRYDLSKSFRSIIKDIITQAEKRQSESPGATIVGTVLQHLVGAKINLLLEERITQHGASVKDEALGRDGDFVIDDVVIHVTTAPSEALLNKCISNLDSGLKPIIITSIRGVPVAEGLAGQMNIGERIDIFEAEQFLAGNLYEIGKFAPSGRRATAEQLINEYNRIIDECETEPGLHIRIGQ